MFRGQNYLTDVGAYPASLRAPTERSTNPATFVSGTRHCYPALIGVCGAMAGNTTNVGWPESTNRSGGLDPSQEGPMFGFRVASVPEPSTLALLLAGAVALLACTWRRRASRKLLAVVSVVWFMGLAGAACAATPGQLLLSIPSPGPAYSGFGHGLSVSGNEIAIGAYGLTNVVFRSMLRESNWRATRQAFRHGLVSARRWPTMETGSWGEARFTRAPIPGWHR